MTEREIVGSYHFAASDPNDELLDEMWRDGLRIVGPTHSITVDNLDFLITGEVHGVTIETIYPDGRREIEGARD